MGFRQPFTRPHRPDEPGVGRRRRVLPRQLGQPADRAPAGICEWNLVDKPGFFGWPFCVGDNSTMNTHDALELRDGDLSTGQRYDCSQQDLPSDIEWAPPGRHGAPPTFQGRSAHPRAGDAGDGLAQVPRQRGRAGSDGVRRPERRRQQPVTGPVYRHREGAGDGAFPAYYDGSWLITNRGTDERLLEGGPAARSDTNQMLRVNDWLPFNTFGHADQQLRHPDAVRPGRSAVHGAVELRLLPQPASAGVADRVGQDRVRGRRRRSARATCSRRPRRTRSRVGRHPDGAYVDSATLRLSANDVGCAGVERDRVPGQRRRMDGLQRTGYVRRGGLATRSSTGPPIAPATRRRRRARRSRCAEEHRRRTTCDSFAKGTAWDPDELRRRVRRPRDLALRPARRAVPARRVAGAAGRQPRPERAPTCSR